MAADPGRPEGEEYEAAVANVRELLTRLLTLSQRTVTHARECPAGRTARMLRWERVKLTDCTCPVFEGLASLAAAVGIEL